MQKPIKPPLPSNEPPSKIKEIETVVIERDGKLDLKPVDYEDTSYWYDGSFDKRIYDFVGESIKSIGLNYPIKNFEIFLQDYCNVIVKLYTKKSAEIYNQELLDFENRFINYEFALTDYEDNLKIYEDWSREQRILKLQQEWKQILNLESGLKTKNNLSRII